MESEISHDVIKVSSCQIALNQNTLYNVLLSIDIEVDIKGGGVAQAVECLLCKYKALSSNSSHTHT
jgi:hypothetical protein